MSNIVDFFSELFPGFQAALVFAATVILALGVRHVALWVLDRSACHRMYVSLVVQSVRWPSLALCMLVGVYAILDSGVAHLTPRGTAFVLKMLHAGLVLTATLAIARLAQSSVEYLLQQKMVVPKTGASLSLIRVLVWVIGLLVMLKGIGVEITPILTALGVGGLAVSLALQDTLANFFAGIQILVDKPIMLGDRVKLESGQEGAQQQTGSVGPV
jgi:small-conductance mechanosensitive channel